MKQSRRTEITYDIIMKSVENVRIIMKLWRDELNYAGHRSLGSEWKTLRTADRPWLNTLPL